MSRIQVYGIVWYREYAQRIPWTFACNSLYVHPLVSVAVCLLIMHVFLGAMKRRQVPDFVQPCKQEYTKEIVRLSAKDFMYTLWRPLLSIYS